MSVNSNSTASQLNMKKTLSQKFSHLLPVSVINLYCRISPRIFERKKKNEMPDLDTQGPEKTDS
jgi:hypothetical protein